MSNDSTIVKILTFEDTTGNPVLDSQLDPTALEMFDRTTYVAPHKIEDLVSALQSGIYG